MDVRPQTQLVQVVGQLSRARTAEAVQAVVRGAARQLVNADGATFVLRDGDYCHYVDEDAISPLWKGQRLPLTGCISGWTMLNRTPAVIEDIYQDDRIPVEAYRPTFVKSLVMVPIRREEPIGAIGTYWARFRRTSAAEVEMLQALADTTSVALESAQLYRDLERRVQDRTRQLELANQELEAFSYTVSHDLRAPVRAIRGFAGALEQQGCGLDEAGRGYLKRILSASSRMTGLIDDLLELSRISRVELRRQPVDLSEMAGQVVEHLEADSSVEFALQPGMWVDGDPGLLKVVLQNLLDNAWKYSSKKAEPRVEFGCTDGIFAVRDNGAGFSMEEAPRLFAPFVRLHHPDDFSGTGIGLATVQRVIHRHGGRIWAEASPEAGATFYFTLG